MVILKCKSCLFFFITLSIIQSCAPLTKSQITLTHNYFEGVTSMPEFYRETNTRIAEISLGARRLESALTRPDSLKVQVLIGAIREYEAELVVPDTILFHLRVVEDYVQNFYVLIPSGFDIYRVIKSTSVTLSGLIGLGGVTKSLLPDKSLKVSKAKARKIRQHLVSSSENVVRSVGFLKYYIDEHYLPQLDKVDQESRENLELLLLNLTDKPDPIVYYRDYNLIISNYYQRVFLTKQMTEMLTIYLDVLIVSEGQVMNKTAERIKLTDQTKNISEMARLVQRMRSTNEKIIQVKGAN